MSGANIIFQGSRKSSPTSQSTARKQYTVQACEEHPSLEMLTTFCWPCSEQEYPNAKKEATHSLRSSRTSEADRAAKMICFAIGLWACFIQTCARLPSATDFLTLFATCNVPKSVPQDLCYSNWVLILSWQGQKGESEMGARLQTLTTSAVQSASSA